MQQGNLAGGVEARPGQQPSGTNLPDTANISQAGASGSSSLQNDSKGLETKAAASSFAPVPTGSAPEKQSSRGEPKNGEQSAARALHAYIWQQQHHKLEINAIETFLKEQPQHAMAIKPRSNSALHTFVTKFPGYFTLKKGMVTAKEPESAAAVSATAPPATGNTSASGPGASPAGVTLAASVSPAAAVSAAGNGVDSRNPETPEFCTIARKLQKKHKWTDEPNVNEKILALLAAMEPPVWLPAYKVLNSEPGFFAQCQINKLCKGVDRGLIKERQKGLAEINKEKLYSFSLDKRHELRRQDKDLRDLSRELNVTTTDLGRYLAGKRAFKKAINATCVAEEDNDVDDDDGDADDPCKTKWAEECIRYGQEDKLTGYKLQTKHADAMPSKIQKAGDDGERRLYDTLSDVGCQFKKDNQQEVSQPGGYPDALLESPIIWAGRKIHWIDAKAALTVPSLSPPQIVSTLERQVARYTEAHGPGALFWALDAFSTTMVEKLPQVVHLRPHLQSVRKNKSKPKAKSTYIPPRTVTRQFAASNAALPLVPTGQGPAPSHVAMPPLTMPRYSAGNAGPSFPPYLPPYRPPGDLKSLASPLSWPHPSPHLKEADESLHHLEPPSASRPPTTAGNNWGLTHGNLLPIAQGVYGNSPLRAFDSGPLRLPPMQEYIDVGVSGAGHRLGETALQPSAAPAAVSAEATVARGSVTAASQHGHADENEAKIHLKVKLKGGKSLSLALPSTATVEDLFLRIASASGTSVQRLRCERRELGAADWSLTLHELNMDRCVLQQMG